MQQALLLASILINSHIKSLGFFTYHSLNLTSSTRLTMNGFLILKGLMNFDELDAFRLNFSLNQTLFNKKLPFSLNAHDVLKTMPNHFTLIQGLYILRVAESVTPGCWASISDIHTA